MPKVRSKRSEKGKKLVDLIVQFNRYGDGTNAYGTDDSKRLTAARSRTDEQLEEALIDRLSEALFDDETGAWIEGLPPALTTFCIENDLLELDEEDSVDENESEPDAIEEEDDIEDDDLEDPDDLEEPEEVEEEETEEAQEEEAEEESEEDDTDSRELTRIVDDVNEASDALADFIVASLEKGCEIRLTLKKAVAVPAEAEVEEQGKKPKTQNKMFTKIIAALEETKVPKGTMQAFLQHELSSHSLRKKFAEEMDIPIKGGIADASGKKLAYAIAKWADETYQ